VLHTLCNCFGAGPSTVYAIQYRPRTVFNGFTSKSMGGEGKERRGERRGRKGKRQGTFIRVVRGIEGPVLLCTNSTLFSEMDNVTDSTSTAGDGGIGGVTSSSTADEVTGDEVDVVVVGNNVVIIYVATAMTGIAMTIFIAIVCKTRGPYPLHQCAASNRLIESCFDLGFPHRLS